MEKLNMVLSCTIADFTEFGVSHTFMGRQRLLKTYAEIMMIL